MEIIIICLADIIISLATAAIMLTADLLLLLGNLLVCLFTGAAFSARSKLKPQDKDLAPPKPFKQWPRRLVIICSSLMVVFLLAIAVVNAFFFESTTRWLVGQAQKKTGVELNFEQVKGSFWSGEFEFQQLTAKQNGQDNHNFDITVKSAQMDVAMVNLLWQNLVIESLKIDGVECDWENLIDKSKNSGKGAPKKPLKARRSFTINNLDLQDITIAYRHVKEGQPLTESIRVDKMRAAPLRSNWLVFDLLFKGQAQGAYNGFAFTIENPNEKTGGQARQTLWRFDNIPVSALGKSIGGPLAWFESGQANLLIHNHSEDGDAPKTTMNWSLTVENFKAVPPAGDGPAAKASAALVEYMNKKCDRLELAFTLELGPDDLRLTSSDDLSELVKTKAAQELGDVIKKEAVKLKDKVIDGFKTKWR